MADSQRWGGDMDCVYLVLLCDGEEKTGLKIPLIDMRRNFKRPLKCLRAMALAVLGVSGHISVEVGGPAVANAELQSLEPELGGKVYHYVMDVPSNLQSLSVVVPLLVSKTRSLSVSSAGDRDVFRDQLVGRDKTSRYKDDLLPSRFCDGCHLVPHSKGEVTVEHILENRPGAHDGKSRVMASPAHNDVKNGILLERTYHFSLDNRELVLIHTPSLYLDADDLQPPSIPNAPSQFASTASRWTWIWLKQESFLGTNVPEVFDTSFRLNAHQQNPHPVLLDYIFGAAVLKHWGFNAESFFDAKRMPNFPKTTSTLNAPSKKARSAQDREATAAKRSRALNDEGEGSSRPSQPGGHGMSRQQAEKIMAMLAACSPTGRAFAKAQQEKEAAARASIESWVHQIHSACDDDSPEPDGAHGSQPTSDSD